MSDEERFPSIGDIHDGEVLVCMGDDRPDQWDGWLEPLVDRFEALERIADKHDLELKCATPPVRLGGWEDFCEAIGVSVGRKFWEGSMISGYFVMGWIKRGKVRSARKAGLGIIRKLERGLIKQQRKKQISELTRIEDLDELLGLTPTNFALLNRRNAQLNAGLEASEKSLRCLNESVAAAKQTQTEVPELTRACLNLACAILNKDRSILCAGPLVLWSDGVVYAITVRGGVNLPADSSPALLLKELQRAGHAVVEVEEYTAVRGYLHSHPIRGTPHISGWLNVWSQIESVERKFTTGNPEHFTVLREIHEHFKAQQ